jgi:hypothetical protein
MSDLSPGRERRGRRGKEPEGGSEWTDELACLDDFEVAFRNLLATRARVLELSRTWNGSVRLAPVSARLVSWLSECGRDEIVEVIGDLRAGIESEGQGRLSEGSGQEG